MIQKAPKASKLLSSGKELLNLSWRLVMDIVCQQQEDWFSELPQKQKNMYWKNARRDFLTAHTLLVQGIELIIKSRIASVSPLLLIERLSDNSIQEDGNFSDCKTIQESVLVSYHNKVSEKKISSVFDTKFKKMLNLRNEIIHLETNKHTKISEIKLLANNVLTNIMYVSEELIREKWFKIREEFLEDVVYIYDDGDITARILLCREFNALKNTLTASEYGRFFHHSIKAENYYCIKCYDKCGWSLEREFENYKFAVIDPKDQTQMYCPVCDSHFAYKKYKCKVNHCRKALHASDHCLCCLEEDV